MYSVVCVCSPVCEWGRTVTSKSENEMANECAWRGSFTSSTCAHIHARGPETPSTSPLPRPYSQLYIRCPLHADANYTDEPYRTCLGLDCDCDCDWKVSFAVGSLWSLGRGQPLTEFQAIIIAWRANMRKVFEHRNGTN